MRIQFASLHLAWALVLSGCLTSPSELGAPDGADLALPPIPAWIPAKVGIGGDAESSVTVSPDGKTVLACSHGGFTKPSPLWASEDGGATWRHIDPQPNPIVSGDCDLAITANGDWFIVYDTIASATVAGSSDKGRTWRFHYLAAPPVGGVDRPWIQAVGNELYLIYADVMAAEPFVSFFTKSSDGGRTFSPPEVMGYFRGTEQSNCFIGHHIVKDGGRTVRVPINCWPEYTSSGNTFPSFINLMTSRDGGRTWITERVAGPHTTSLRTTSASYAGPGDATLWLTYSVDNATGGRDLFAIRSLDDGKTWSAALLVAGGRQVPLGWAWLDGRPDGSATMAWMDNKKPSNVTGPERYWQVYAARLGPEGNVSWVMPVGAPATGNALYEFLMLRHDAEGRAHIVYVLPGEGCKVTPPPFGAQDRNKQCVHFLKEDPA
ncbi:MAG: exo-alpha-sialidase [Euryarchaeota archaeon]|nr:exo-alpha-sialidase [Euryarchaeota archaeon]